LPRHDGVTDVHERGRAWVRGSEEDADHRRLDSDDTVRFRLARRSRLSAVRDRCVRHRGGPKARPLGLRERACPRLRSHLTDATLLHDLDELADTPPAPRPRPRQRGASRECRLGSLQELLGLVPNIAMRTSSSSLAARPSVCSRTSSSSLGSSAASECGESRPAARDRRIDQFRSDAVALHEPRNSSITVLQRLASRTCRSLRREDPLPIGAASGGHPASARTRPTSSSTSSSRSAAV
jgi:hypothetical protein